MANNANGRSALDPELINYVKQPQVVTASSALNSGIGTNVSRKNLSNYMSNASYANLSANNTSEAAFINGLDTAATAGFTTVNENLLSTSLAGLEGAPYQFHQDVDSRIKGSSMGRKYAEKLYSRMPILFIMPCVAEFMEDFGKEDKQNMIQIMLARDSINLENVGSLFQGEGRFYTPKYAFSLYYDYLNLMLQAVANYIGIGGVKIPIGKNGRVQALGSAVWDEEANDDYVKNFICSSSTLAFYVDSLSDVSQSFSNSYGDSSLAATINGFADTANEIKFLFGAKGNAIADAIGGTGDMLSSVTGAFGSMFSNLGGSIVGSLASSGVNTILNGGKIIFPQVWQDSSNNDESYSFNFKFRSPDHDNLSVFLNVLKPYCKLLALVMAHQDANNPNGYNSPFLVKAACKGMFNIDLGGISGMNVTKGAECQWNSSGLPTQIDVSIDIQNLYSHLSMSNESFLQRDLTKNTAYMDFLANTAGLNVFLMETGKKAALRLRLTGSGITNTPHDMLRSFENQVTNFIGPLINW